MIPNSKYLIKIILAVLILPIIEGRLVIAQEKQATEPTIQQDSKLKKKKNPDVVKKKVPKPDFRKIILQNPAKVPLLLKQGKITVDKIPNPHWQKDACKSCHKSSKRAGLKNLRKNRVDDLCNTCHESVSAHNYIHVSDIKLPTAMLKRMPQGFRAAVKRAGNKMTCITCHDLPMTCEKRRYKEKGLNPNFFRGGPYRSRTEICYKCHDEKKYQRINAHDQINNKGQLQKDKCLICHIKNQDMATANIIADVEYNLKDNLSRLCWGCHPWKPHPGGSFSFFSGGFPNHLVKPSEDILRRMREKQEEHDILLPLEPGTGKVYCATCHNPHERGVIKLEAAAKGADEKKRLRMQDICQNCHDK